MSTEDQKLIELANAAYKRAPGEGAHVRPGSPMAIMKQLADALDASNQAVERARIAPEETLDTSLYLDTHQGRALHGANKAVAALAALNRKESA